LWYSFLLSEKKDFNPTTSSINLYLVYRLKSFLFSQVFRNGLSNVIFFTLREPIRTAVRRQLARVRRHSASLYNGSGGELSSPKSLKMLSKQPEEHNRMMETVVADFCSGAVYAPKHSTKIINIFFNLLI
jgi:hypothetical protein